jgi:DNA helicase HerA-like ATPase
MESEIGTVVSTLKGPSPGNIDFVVTKGVMHRGQFVEIDYSEGKLIALVNDVVKTNRYFERADAVKEFESSGYSLAVNFPAAEWEFMLASTRPLGVYTKDGRIKRPTYPPSPGSGVKVAGSGNLRKFLGFSDDGMMLGSVEYHDLEVRLGMDRMLKKHLAILAMSGAGKSVAVKSMIEELLARKREQGRIAILVMDVHGEYTNFAEPVRQEDKGKFSDYSSVTKLVKAKDIRIGVPRLSISLIASIVSGLSIAQRRELEKIMNRLRSEMKSGAGSFDLNDLKSVIMADKDIKSNTSTALIAWLDSLSELGIFSKADFPSLSDLTKPAQLTVIDMSEIVDLRKKQIILAYYGRKLFEERRRHKVPPFLLVVEEAHQFAPEKAREEIAISKPIIETIAREGRKFGASLCLVSQRPINLSTTALSQCNTHLILRVTNPYDLKHIGESSEGLDYKSQEMITSLKVGEGLLVGEAVNYPVFFGIRKNRSQPSKHEISLEESARNFEESQEIKKDDAEAFL